MEFASATRTSKVAFVILSIVFVLLANLVLLQPANASDNIPEDGTTFRGSRPKIYLVEDNGYYVVSNTQTLNTCLGGSSDVERYSNTRVRQIKSSLNNLGEATCRVDYPNGTMLSAPSDSKVYVIFNGHKYWVTSGDAVVNCLGGWGAVRHITDVELQWSNTYYPYSGEFRCYNNGQMLQASSPGVIYIKNNHRYNIPNTDVLNCLGGWGNVSHISDTEWSNMLNTYADSGTAVCFGNGTLVQASGPGVILISHGTWKSIPNPDILNCYGGWGRVVRISDGEWNQLMSIFPASGAAACAVSYPNGTLLQASGPGVMLISHSVRLGIPNPDVLNCYGGWAAVRRISDNEWSQMLATYPDGGSAPGCTPQIGVREQRAVDWMRSQLGVTRWNDWCELMIEQAYGTSGRYPSAIDHANAVIARGQMHSGDRNVPPGAIAYFGRAAVNGNYGHVIISIGNGQFISNGYGSIGARVVTLDNIVAGPYIGWSWADDGWSR